MSIGQPVGTMLRMSIQVLPVHLVNKIAAGEVIERPASVLKELVENAIDAGASRIDVAIEDGGKQLIQVTDNGGGMGLDDLKLAFAPHATSKIRNDDDLFAIHTMGFRGEALASIASISHAAIRTRRPDEEGGWTVTASGETVNTPTPCAAPPGTTVTIRNLFFNTPARRKFLRTTNTEYGHLTEQLNRVALPHPEVAFTLTHNGRETINLPATHSTVQRVGDLFTADLAEALIPITPREDGITVAGLLAKPAAARSSGKWQYIFLNGRFIRDRLLSHALREAHRGLLMPSRYPVVFLFLELDCADVDVNVHPTKVEVRFRESNRVYAAVLAALRETLNQANLTPDVTALHAKPLGQQPSPDSAEREASMRGALADFFRRTPPPPAMRHSPTGSASHPASAFGNPPVGASRLDPAGNPALPTSEDFLPMGQTPPSPPPAFEDSPRPAPESDYALAPPAAQAKAVRALLQIHNTYIVAETDEGLILVDQHALHERILYNEFQTRVLSGQMTRQRMLIPEPLTVTPAEAALFETHSDLLAKLGFEIAPFGPSTVAVQQYPTLLAERGVKMDSFLRELLDQLADEDTLDPERILDEVLSMMSCKAAVKAGDPLTPDEMHNLLARAEGVTKRSSCPHGRPTIIQLTLHELEKQFRRI